ncbi:MAG: trypsin-like peptidase domain-containing protein [Actinomycetota bacterium]|nr:trypsin-like peptidase domain-containing protein [Actinomycetota bacterium]
MKTRWAIALLCLVLLSGGCAFMLDEQAPSATATDFEIEQNESRPPASDVADVVEKVLPSVVNVRVRSFQFGSDENVQGQGSGVIIDSDGIILTNFHVVSGAVTVEVFFAEEDQDSVEGTVIGTDPERDLAVIQVPVDGLTEIEVGKSSSLRLGDTAIAVGFPLGLGGPSVTSGIISGRARTIDVPRQDGEIEHLQGMLQTDAAINPGNSGGPLVDAQGRLVGINTAAASAGAAENIGFAISIDSALPVIREIMTEPAAKRAWLGVTIAPVDPAIAQLLGLDSDVRGALITDLVPEGPADSAGLEDGDVITAIGEEAVDSPEDVTEALVDLDPGDEVEVTFVNEDGADSVVVELAQRPLTFSQ